jgi:hypothetical protein
MRRKDRLMGRNKCEEKKGRKKEEILKHKRIRNVREKVKERRIINRTKQN